MALVISPKVPRRTTGVSGARPPNFPDLNWQVVGRAIGASPTWIGRIMNGTHRPSMDLAVKLSAYLGITLDQINSLYRPKR